MNPNGHNPVQKQQQEQMLKLVTRSFCNELTRYGADMGDIVTTSALVLDYVLNKQTAPPQVLPLYAQDIDPDEVVKGWISGEELKSGMLILRPLQSIDIPVMKYWLANTDIQNNFTTPFPVSEEALHEYFLATPERSYFSINHEGLFIGVIGAEAIDQQTSKLEMKKFIGDIRYRGKGIGKKATSLWLVYIFNVLGYNKVYLYSLDTNMRNINLNAALGFELEGVLFQEASVGGMYKDVVRMSLLRSKWMSLLHVKPKIEIEAANSM